MPLSPDEMSEMLTRLTNEGMSATDAMRQIAIAAGVAAPPSDPAPIVEPAVAEYLQEVQARLSDPTALARATALAAARGLDLETLTFGDLTDLVNDATATPMGAESVGAETAGAESVGAEDKAETEPA
jgi:hypothetical protein